MSQYDNYRRRYERLKAARLLATHTRQEWIDLLNEFDHRCVKCGIQMHMDKDHIVPLYKGGSDGIENLQPLCYRCNASKGADSRNWKTYRRIHGFSVEVSECE